MPSRRTFLGSVSAVGLASLAGCGSSGTSSTPDPRDGAAFREDDQSTETSSYVESRRPSEGPLLTERGIGTPLDGSDPDDHWLFIDTSSHRAELESATRSEQASALLNSVDLAEAFVFVYQVQNHIPVSLTEVVATGTYQDRFYFHLAWDDDATRLSTPTVKTWFVVVPGTSRPGPSSESCIPWDESGKSTGPREVAR